MQPKLTARAACLALVCSVSAACLAATASGTATPVAGWTERARITPGDVVVEAKLDTGADASSLHAAWLQRFQRDGNAWIAFEVTAEDGRSVRIERPVVRTARVRSALGAGQARPVVRLGICIGSVYRVTDVSLVDRGRLNVRLLIGRRFLDGHLLVDSARRELHEPSCKDAPAP